MPEEYTDEIRYLTPQDHVRKCPHMYFGTDSQALHQLVYEVLNHSLEQVKLGECQHIGLTLHPGHWITVRDDSPGIPIHSRDDKEPSFLESFMTTCWVRMRKIYPIDGGLNGIGLSAVNALAAECEVEVAREGYLWRQTYREGLPHTEVSQVRPLTADETTGTQIRFRPDFTILELNEFQYDLLADRARELAFLLPGLTFTLRDERGTSPQEEVFTFPGGLADYVAYLNRDKSVVHAPLTGGNEWTIQPKDRQAYKIGVDVAFQYTSTMETTIIGYVNTVRTTGGLHFEVFTQALREVLNLLPGSESQPFALDEITPGLTAVVSIKHSYPSFESMTNMRLLNHDVCGIVADVSYHAFNSFVTNKNHQQETNRLLEKCAENRRAMQK